MAERNSRKVYTGRVVSDKMEQTNSVEDCTYKTHPVYGQRVKYTQKFYAHDEEHSE